MLALENLTVGYRERGRVTRTVLSGLRLRLRRGELVCMLGPNGAGKSTLMRTVAGLQPPIEGVVTLDNSNLHAIPPRTLARRLAVVLTERVSAGLMSAYELVALGRHPFSDWTGRLTAADRAAIDHAIRAVGAESLAARLVAELSDGERQKIMVARALAQEPDVMILDEITAFLDLPRRVEIMHILRGLAHDHGKAILLSTHDLDLALHAADVVWLVSADRVTAGIPEALVLDGTFGRAFAAQGVTFDATRGTFQVAHRGRGVVRIDGNDLHATWTRRAFERRGFHVIDGASDQPISAHITVSKGENGPSWTIVRNDTTEHAESLAQALAAVVDEDR